MMKQFLIVSSGKEKNMLNKRDIKYIVKKVIIILIVALIFYFIRNIPVKADSVSNYVYDCSSGNNYNYCTSTSTSNVNSSYLPTYDIYYSSGNTSNYSTLLSFYNSDEDYYTFVSESYTTSSSLFRYNVKCDSSFCQLYTNNQSAPNFTNPVFITKSQSAISYIQNNYTIPSNLTLYQKELVIDNITYYILRYQTNTYLYLFPTSLIEDKKIQFYDLKKYDNNTGNFSITPQSVYFYKCDSYYQNCQELDFEYNSNIGGNVVIPNNYSEIDLQGYQGVIVVPKDYTLLPTTIVNNIDFYKFPFYYVGCQSYGYFSLQNSQMIVSDLSNINVCSSTPTLIEALFPVYYDEYNSVSGVGTQQYQSNAIVIYNRNYDYSLINPYASTKIYINLSLYNYELVSDFKDYSSSFTYIDKNGNEFTQNITNIFSFEELLKNGVKQDSVSDNLSTRQKIDIMLDYFKLPFNFLSESISSPCGPLRAQFPHSNDYIELPCISGIVEEHLPEGFLTFIRMLVNGFVLYRCIMTTSIFIINQMNPHDLGIEVIDL